MTYASPFPRFTHVAVTLRLADPVSDLLVRQIALLRDCVALAQARWPFEIEAAIVLPSEMQMLCCLPEGDTMETRLRLIRSAFAHHVTDDPLSDLWDDEVLLVEVPSVAVESRRQFLLEASVRARLVTQADAWPYSSLHRRGAPRAITQVA